MENEFKLLSMLNEELLKEMAFSRKDAMGRSYSLGSPIAIHIIKSLFLDVSPETRDHWFSELDAWLNDVDDMKLTGKGRAKLRPIDYFDSLFHRHLGDIQKLQTIKEKVLKDEPSYSFISDNDEEAHNMLTILYQSICADLGKYGTFKGIRNYINFDGTLKV